MGRYFSTKKDYYLLTMEDIVNLLKGNTADESELVTLKKNQYIKENVADHLFCIDVNNIDKVKDDLEKICKKLLGIEERMDRAAKFEGTVPKPLTPEQIEVAQDEFLEKAKQYLTNVNEIDELNYQDGNTVTVKFEFQRQKKQENIELGGSVSCVTVPLKDSDYFEKSLEKKIKKNAFFKNLCSNINDIEFVKCEELDKDNLCVRFPLGDENLILKQDEIQDYLEKYKEEENVFFRPKVNEFVLA